MTNEEYAAAKAAIEKEHGDPEWDCGAPRNHAAKLIARLRSAKAYAGRKQRVCDSPARDPDTMEESAGRGGLEIDIKEESLHLFTPSETLIIRQYFLNIYQSHRTIAKKLNVEYWKVNRLIQSKRFKDLYDTAMKRAEIIESHKTLLRALREGDSKVAVEIQRDQGLMKNETLVLQPRIEDPKALDALKALGDSLVVRELGQPLTPETPTQGLPS